MKLKLRLIQLLGERAYLKSTGRDLTPTPASLAVWARSSSAVRRQCRRYSTLGRQTAFLHREAGIGWIAQSSGTRIWEHEEGEHISIEHTHRRTESRPKATSTTG